MVSLEFFTMALELTQHLPEMSTRNISWGIKAAGVRAVNLTTFMCRLSRNLGASASGNPQGLSRLYYHVRTASGSHPTSYPMRGCPLKYVGAELCEMLR